ncbi:TetR/AcrR family transcriptional regulator [Antrihabitans sp. YC2-6]|uniref:TetR/AcrR family transcriptional regulator n=1 Tax=Antrihabitans sp. YC2-6 TaxID=2799498 RepID=UPI0018F5423F|nr:TetR/AcrR family transcriptional regulator [Antrihabitans sp. YC2-6]MBJ8348438.1 TetR/AcrR family transcriptional regulator [Antrihabitans sp. YC2-6]
MEVKSQPKRGRPPQSAEDAERVRESIVAATAEVFAEHGSHGMSVALILERAGIARPTFYRYFSNADEPLNVFLDRTDQALVRGIVGAIGEADDDVAMAIAVIDSYLEWADHFGPALRPLFSELYDPASPVSVHRERALDQVRTLAVARMVELGRPVPDPLDLDTLLNACEFIVYRIAATENPDADLTARARSAMIRVAIATLGQPDDLVRALSVPGIFR